MELTSTPIVALTLEGEFVGNYGSAKQAADELKVDSRDIHRSLTGTQVRVNNYLFIRAEKYDPKVKVTYKSILRKRRFLKLKVNIKR